MSKALSLQKPNVIYLYFAKALAKVPH